MDTTLVAALLAGLLGGVHCVGMCSGISGALTMGLPDGVRTSSTRLFPYQLAYNLGRIFSYAVAGALVGALGAGVFSLGDLQQTRLVVLFVAALFMLVLGLYIGGWWSGLLKLEQLGGHVWKRIEPLGRGLLPVRSLPHAFLLGVVWGWLPCGLVYSLLTWALASGSARQGALLMFVFGLGTLPVMLLMGSVFGSLSRYLQQTWVRRLAGGLVVLLGVHALYRASILTSA